MEWGGEGGMKVTISENHTYHIVECGLRQHLKLSTHSHEVFGFIVLAKTFPIHVPRHWLQCTTY